MEVLVTQGYTISLSRTTWTRAKHEPDCTVLSGAENWSPGGCWTVLETRVCRDMGAGGIFHVWAEEGEDGEERKKGLFPRLSCFCPFSVLCTRDGGTRAHQMPLWLPRDLP